MEFRRRWMGVWTALLIAGLLAPSAVGAQDSTLVVDSIVDPISVTSQPAGVSVQWQAPAAQAGSIEGTGLPMVHYQGYDLPIEFLTFEAAGADPANVLLTALDAVELSEGIAPTARALPPVLDFVPDPAVTVPEKIALPDRPIFVVGEGRLHDRLLVKVAISPLYNDKGVVKIATRIEATIAGVAQLQTDLQTPANAGEVRAAMTEAVNVPVNAAALRNAFKLVVDKPGVQEVYYRDLGLSSAPADMLLTYDGAEIALERLTDRFRFYAPRVGDRWNLNSAYWLTLQPGVMRIGPRGGAPASTPGVVYQRTRWTDNHIYDSTRPGADGDRWFNADLRVEPTASDYPSATIPITTVLPLRSGKVTISADVTPLLTPSSDACFSGEAGYRLEASFLQDGLPNGSQIQAWAPGCILPPSNTITWETTAPMNALRLRLLPAPDYSTGIELDSVTWQAPVRLNFHGVSEGSVDLWTLPGGWSYAWTNLPGAAAEVVGDPADVSVDVTEANDANIENATKWQLYDVTIEAQPQIVPASTSGFNQAAGSTARHYVLAQLNALAHPQVIVHQAVNFSGVKAADAIYIGPARFAAATKPLLDLRKQQGYAPLYIDIQQIYDVYGYGHISSTAVRNFLRHATDWQNLNRQISVVLVGDGNYDPHDYWGLHNENLVPPFMEDVDPLLREAACEPCYAQLNGDDAKTGDYRIDNQGIVTAWFVQDVWIGRFPVRSEQEVTDVVAKIVKYETTGGSQDLWRSRHVLVADNYIRHVDDERNYNAEIDEAGDFATDSDRMLSRFPARALVDRVYYDPYPTRKVRTNDNGQPAPTPGKPGFYVTDQRPAREPWRIDKAPTANFLVVKALSAGAGLVVYNGHSNHWQWARTSESDYLNWLLRTTDVDLLFNYGKPFIGLSMTCYTAQFAIPADAGTLDELTFRKADAGAVAVWGPSGLTVTYAHDLLQRGFMKRLWSKPSMSQRMGELLEAGYSELLLNSTGVEDTLMTFLLLGDPLTKARITANQGLFLPEISAKH